MSEEDEGSNNEENEEGEEKEDDEEQDNEEGDKKEDNEEKEDDDNEGEEKEDEEDDKKNKKKKDKKKKEKGKSKKEGKEKDNKKGGKKDNNSNKENKNEQKLENSNNIIFNGNDITVGNISQKKSTIQILMEISTDMESLSSHIDKTIPIKPLEPVKQNNYNYNDNYNANITFHNMDKEDLEIKKLINQANELSNNSKLNNNINQFKSYEDKCCQSDEDVNNEFYNHEEEKEPFDNNNINYNSINERRNEFPYDPNRHLGYYNNLNNNKRQISNNNYQNRPNNNYGYNQNNNASFNSLRIKKMDELYSLSSNTRKQPIIYTQPQSSNNTMRNKMIDKYDDNFGLNEINDVNNRNGQDNFNNQKYDNENYETNNYENTNKNNDLENNNNYFREKNYSSNNNNYINENNEQKSNYENKFIIQDNNNNNFNLNQNNFDNNENKYERFRPKSINQAMNILLDKE